MGEIHCIDLPLYDQFLILVGRCIAVVAHRITGIFLSIYSEHNSDKGLSLNPEYFHLFVSTNFPNAVNIARE